MPRVKSLYNLSKKNIRMSWNKYNLYNMNRFDLKKFNFEGEVKVFAKHQLAKRIARKYHGQGLTERIFKTQLYNPRFNVVAGGHEGGKRLLWGGLFRGVERRLDTVIFRSLFASSIQQARQLVVHGHVEVNGKKECRPGLLLKPGDIYHANPQMVRKCISAHFHKKHLVLDVGRRHEMMVNRDMFLRKRGQKPSDVIPERPPLSHLYEFNPYVQINAQGIHPIFQQLDEQARREERFYQKYLRFIPKPFMAAQVFLPAYLEVSYRSCTGCFVRFPQIKRDSSMEIPSPYPASIHEQAGMWYIKYAKKAARYQRGYRGFRLFPKNKQGA